MKMLLLTPIFGRPEITKIWADCLWTNNVLCILSPEDKDYEKNLKIVKSKRLFHINWPNTPLGAKMNAGIKAAMGLKWDYLMNLDSDGVLHRSIMDVYKPYFDAKKPFFGMDKVHFFNKKTLEIRKSRDYYWCSGRVIARKTLELMKKRGYLPYFSADTRGMDCRSNILICKEGICEYDKVSAGKFPYILDIKSWDNLNDWNFITNQSDPAPDDLIRNNFPHKTVKAIYGL
jgi:glycosyltransferase involved in cell wall biosynthesis